MSAFVNHSLVRILLPITVEEEGKKYPLPAGSIGTIVDVSPHGATYVVEFLLSPATFDQDGYVLEYPLEAIAVVKHEDLEPVQ